MNDILEEPAKKSSFAGSLYNLKKMLQLPFMRSLVIKAVLSFLVVASSGYLNATITLQEKFSHANEGDFIVSTQEGHHSVLFIRSLNLSTLLLEEITVPLTQIDLKRINWKQWVQKKAPGHTSWTLYEIDLSSGELIECFSFSKNGWLQLDRSDQILTRLLSLPLSPVSDLERKKIGSSSEGEEDRRAFWNPPLVIEGEKKNKTEFNVLKTLWPEDGSELALCSVEFYFAKQLPNFPFPFWVEVKSPHYAFKMRTIDSGQTLISPIPGPMPHRPPQILGTAQKGALTWKLPIRTPSYFSKLQLFALDATDPKNEMISLPFCLTKKEKPEEALLEIQIAQMQPLLKRGHRYHFVLIPQNAQDIYVESEESFLW